MDTRVGLTDNFTWEQHAEVFSQTWANFVLNQRQPVKHDIGVFLTDVANYLAAKYPKNWKQLKRDTPGFKSFIEHNRRR